MDSTAIIAILFWLLLYLIPFSVARSRNKSVQDLFRYYLRRLVYVAILCLVSAILGTLMSGSTGFIGGALGALLSGSWIVFVNGAYNADKTPQQ